mgnify:FL=1
MCFPEHGSHKRFPCGESQTTQNMVNKSKPLNPASQPNQKPAHLYIAHAQEHNQNPATFGPLPSQVDKDAFYFIIEFYLHQKPKPNVKLLFVASLPSNLYWTFRHIYWSLIWSYIIIVC